MCDTPSDAFISLCRFQDNPNPRELAATAAVAVGCIVTSYCVWYYSGRYVGELSLLLPAERRELCFSVLDFWGSRQVRGGNGRGGQPAGGRRGIIDTQACGFCSGLGCSALSPCC